MLTLRCLVDCQDFPPFFFNLSCKNLGNKGKVVGLCAFGLVATGRFGVGVLTVFVSGVVTTLANIFCCKNSTIIESRSNE